MLGVQRKQDSIYLLDAYVFSYACFFSPKPLSRIKFGFGLV